MRLRFGTAIGGGSAGTPRQRMQPLSEVPESPPAAEAQDQGQDDVWDEPSNAVGEEEADAENRADEEASDWDIGEEPAGLESDFRFDLKGTSRATQVSLLRTPPQARLSSLILSLQNCRTCASCPATQPLGLAVKWNCLLLRRSRFSRFVSAF
jgi:hypothetical protein